MRILLAGLIIAATALIAAPSPDGALAAADVHVKWMNCALHPGQLDIVYIENTGDAPQDLTGWELRSDGENERMSLTPAGTIDPGQEIFATAGAHAVNLPDEDVFLWSNDEMLRDAGDPPDYVRLLDPSGIQVSGMDCNHNLLAAPTAEPTAPPAGTPAPTPPPAPAAQIRPVSSNTGASSRPSAGTQSLTSAPEAPESVPVGGGPPGVRGGNAAAWLFAGLLAMAGGLAMIRAAAPRQTHQAHIRQEGSSRRCGN